MSAYYVLYRGSLSSCNYSCDYCPFAKTANTHEELRQDAQEVNRFVDWVEAAKHSIGVLFTPWGEAIIHTHYRLAMVRLSQMPHVKRVAIQTNLAGGLQELREAQRDTLALWATFHPTQTSIDRFIRRCEELQEMQISFSVGVVGLREHFDDISELRRRLHPDIYLWVNSYKREANYYSVEDLEFLRAIDPYFHLNCHCYSSRGKECRTGETVFTVDGQGEVHRCHFVDKRIGNIYHDEIFSHLGQSACTNATCGCHIGYVHKPELELYQLFGENVLERIPANWPTVDKLFVESGTTYSLH